MIVIRFEYDANILLLQRFYCSLCCHCSSHWWHAKHPSLSDLNMTQDVMNLLIIQKLLQPIGGGLLLTDSSSPTTTSHPHLPPFTPPHPPSPSTLPATHTIVLLWLLRLIPASHNRTGRNQIPGIAFYQLYPMHRKGFSFTGATILSRQKAMHIAWMTNIFLGKKKLVSY